jgi:hypothetical protein
MCGNMGLAMNVVNYLLRRGRGVYLCHLHLDWCAHRLEPPNFNQVFQRAVASYAVQVGDKDSRHKMFVQHATAKAALAVLDGPEEIGITEWLRQNPASRTALLL